MTVVFFGNVLNHHQVALCDELYRQNGGDFYYVEIGLLEPGRVAMGYEYFERDYLIRLRDGEKSKVIAEQLALEADVAIMGADSYPYLKKRLNIEKGVTFSYSERWLKQGLKNVLSPSLLKQYLLYLRKGGRNKWYMLGSSGYQATDMKRLKIFKNRVYKWGYFPKYPEIEYSSRVKNSPAKILWVGRFLKLKRPEMMIGLAEELLQTGYDFQLTMIGEGKKAEYIKERIARNRELVKRVKLRGYCASDEVLEEMRNADIFCFTSTCREGWGAVLGEAMASGCAVVSSNAVGATPFLIDQGKNGLAFKWDEELDFYEKVKYLLDNPREREDMGQAAMKTMRVDWNAKSAACEFLKLAKLKIEDANGVLSDSNLPASQCY